MAFLMPKCGRLIPDTGSCSFWIQHSTIQHSTDPEYCRDTHISSASSIMLGAKISDRRNNNDGYYADKSPWNSLHVSFHFPYVFLCSTQCFPSFFGYLLYFPWCFSLLLILHLIHIKSSLLYIFMWKVPLIWFHKPAQHL